MVEPGGVIEWICAIMAIVCGVYLGWRLLHASGGRGANVGITDIFLTAYASMYVVLVLNYFYDLDPDLRVLGAFGVLFIPLWIILNSKDTRQGLWNWSKGIFGFGGN